MQDGSGRTFGSWSPFVAEVPALVQPMFEYEVIHGCRSCGAAPLETVLNMGDMPLSDGLVRPGGDLSSEQMYPLTLVRCPRCSLVQILETVPPETLFGKDYPYYSSFSDVLVDHARRNVETILDRYPLTDESLVVELASNDGYLLQWFAKERIPVLGIDPAPGPARAAEERGIPTICEFFTPELADRLVSEGRQADVIVGNNVLAHVPDQNRFVAGIERLLAPGGTVVMEFPYVRDLIEHREFDTIYHEHHCYFSVTSVKNLFARQGLDLVRVEHLPIHGGSLRATFQREGRPAAEVDEYLRQEEANGLNDADFYADFAEGVNETRVRLVELIDQLRRDGSTVAAYGAAAKGAIMLNYCRIGAERLAYVVDRNIHKQGWLMPGVHIPIVGPDRLATDPPDYLLILAWNFKDEIMRQQSAYSAGGGRFVVPVPEPAVL